MNLLDVRTVMISYVLSNAICALVIFLLWRRNRGRFSGTGLWLADYVMQFGAVLLIAMRGVLPEIMAVLLGNGLVVGGTILLLIGLERFTGRRGPQWQNVILLGVFLSVHSFFFLVNPSLTARNINLSLALLAVCVQIAWLMLRRTDPVMRSNTSSAGWVFAAYTAISAFRIFADLTVPSGNDFFKSSIYDTLVLMTYQMLFIALTFTLFLMVNRRLFSDLEGELAVRRRVEEAQRSSEEKFSKAFHASPDAILISRTRDGKLLEVNDGFCRLTGYSREEALASSSILLSLWAEPRERERIVAVLRTDRHIQNLEADFRAKSGAILHCQYSGELIDLAGEPYVLSVVHDITQMKNSEDALRRSEANFREVFDNSAQGIFIVDVQEDGGFRIFDSNPAQEMMSGIHRREVRGKRVEDAVAATTAQTLISHYRRCLTEGAPVSMEDDVDLPIGRKFIHTTLAPIRDDSGRIYRIIGSTLDISARKRVEDILHLRLTLWEYAGSHMVDELMQKTLDEIEGITGSPIGFYHFVHEDQKKLSLQAWSTRTLREFCTAEGRGTHYAIDRAGVWADAVRERKPIIHNEYAALPHRKGMPEGHARIERELVVPTMRAGRVVSVLGVGNKPSPYDERDAELLSYIADIVWVIIDRKRTEEEIARLQAMLREMAVHDALTGLYNRHYLEETLNRELARANREKYPVSFVMVDIDHFKKVNDTFGHTAGDAVLRDLASLLRKNTRASDILYRYGGEEFLVVLPKVKSEVALQITEKLRKAFYESTLLLEHGGVKSTISCGIATFPKQGAVWSDLIAGADQAMYQAKAAGRNRSVIWKESKKKK